MGMVRSKTAYSNFALAALWAVVAAVTSSSLVVWPVFLFAVSGVLLMLRPADRFTWAWSMSSVTLGLLLSAYQAFVAITLIRTAFYMVAAVSLVLFLVFAIAHLVVLYAGATPEG